MQPKTYKSPKIALLNIELELKSEKENAEIRVEDVEVRYSWYFNKINDRVLCLKWVATSGITVRMKDFDRKIVKNVGLF